MASKKPCPKTLGLDLFADEPVPSLAVPPVADVDTRKWWRDCVGITAPVVDNSKNGFQDVETLAAYAKAMQGEMTAEVARIQFIQGMRVCERGADIETDGQIDYRKVNRLANGLLGRPESDKPEPNAAEWQAAYTALAESIGLSMEPEE